MLWNGAKLNKKCIVLDYWTSGPLQLYVWYSVCCMLVEMSKLNNLICIIIKIFRWKTIYFYFGSYRKHIQYNFQWIYNRCMIRTRNWIPKTIRLNHIKRKRKKNNFHKHIFIENPSIFQIDVSTSFTRKVIASLKAEETRENSIQHWIEKIFQLSIDRTICKSQFIEMLRRSIGYWYSLISLFQF